jgi:hypothetical protein
MPTLGGLKGPGPKNPALARFLDVERQKRAGQATEAMPPEAQPAKGRDRFDGARGLSPLAQGIAGAPGGGPRQGHDAFSVRLRTLTGIDVWAGSSPVEQALGARVGHASEGRILEGDVALTKAADLELVRGAVAIRGDLDIAETLLASPDLAALSQLRRVQGSLSLEGNPALTALQGLQGLEQVGKNLYLGFCDGLERVCLPSLREVKGALIVEGNRALTALELPALEQVGGYLHLHENPALEGVQFAALRFVGSELSVVDNPRLVAVDMRALERVTGDIEMLDNGAEAPRGLPLLS